MFRKVYFLFFEIYDERSNLVATSSRVVEKPIMKSTKKFFVDQVKEKIKTYPNCSVCLKSFNRV